MPHTREERCQVPFLRACPGLVLRQRMPDRGRTWAAGRDERLGAAGTKGWARGGPGRAYSLQGC